MAKVRASLTVAALCLVSLGIGCGQESTGGPSSGTGGGTGQDSDRSSSASSSVAAAGSGGTALGGQLASSSESGGRGGGSGGTTVASSNPGAGSGGNSVSSIRAGNSSSEAGKTASSGGADAGAGSTASSSAGNTSTRPDGGASLPKDASSLKDASSPSGDTAIIPPPPARPDAGAAFWAAAFPSACKPAAVGDRAQDDGHHKPGTNCMTSGCHLNPKKAKHHAGTDCRGSGCHNNGSPDGSGAPAFLFGGTAYRAATLVAEVGAEIGVKAGSSSYSACSASNGNFWVLAPSGTTSLSWTGASTRLRNANGEAPMMTPPAAGCNASTCHTGTLKITAP